MHKDALLPFSINMSILKKLTLESKLLPSCETIKPNARSSLPKRDGTGHRFQGLGRISDKGKLDLLPHGVSPSALFRFQEHSTLLPPARQMPATWRILCFAASQGEIVDRLRPLSGVQSDREDGARQKRQRRTLGTASRPFGATKCTGNGGYSWSVSRIFNRPSRTCSAT